MRIRLYADEDSMEKNLMRALRTRGVDVLTPAEAGMVDRADDEHLDFATESRRVVLTYNVKDFFRLHKEYLSAGASHAGIILVRQKEYSVGE